MAGWDPTSLDPTTPILDSFDRANEDPLSHGGDWAAFLGSYNYFRVVSNQLQQDTAGLCGAYWNHDVATADSEAYVTVVTVPADGQLVSVFIRGYGLESGAPAYSMLRGGVVKTAGANNDTWEIRQLLNDGAGNNLLTSRADLDLSNGDKIALRIVGDRISMLHCPTSTGVWVEVLSYEWTLSNTGYDTQPSRSGMVGLWTSSTSVVLNDFGGGAITDDDYPYPVNRSFAASSGTSLTVSVPSLTADGDLMLMTVALSSGTPTLPGGWTQLDQNGAGWVAYRVASSEPASYTITGLPGSVDAGATITSYRNVRSPTAIGNHTGSTDTTRDANWPAPQVTTVYDGDLLVFIALGRAGPAYPQFTEPSGWSKRLNYQGNARMISGVFERRQTSHGLTPSATATTSSSQDLDSGVFLVALNGVRPPFVIAATAESDAAQALDYEMTHALAPATETDEAQTLEVLSNAVILPFRASTTEVYELFTLFTDAEGSGPGNGGEGFTVQLAPNGTSVVATLTAPLSGGGSQLHLSGDGGLPTDRIFRLRIDDEQLCVIKASAGLYTVLLRGRGNTAAASHAAAASATWDDSYDVAITAADNIAHEFTADITESGDYTYPGWLMAFDSTQAYLGGSRYPMHVTSLLGVFDAGAGITGSNRCDAAQPNAICVPAAVSDDCPAALSVPARISSDILIGDVAVVRYTNPEASALDLGARSVALQSWFGMMRVDDTNVDVTFTDPDGHVVDTDPGVGDYTGSIDGEWFNPSSIGVGPTTGDPTPNAVPYTSVTLPGGDRYFTYGAPHYSRAGWPICCLAVRQGNRRVPHWMSWDWRNYAYVYSGFHTDATFAHLLVNRNGIVFGSVPEVALPGPQDIDGPDACWDDGSYHFGAAWYVAIFNGPYLVVGPTIGGTGATSFPVTPSVSFPEMVAVVIVPMPPYVEGGEGGDIPPPGSGGAHVDGDFDT